MNKSKTSKKSRTRLAVRREVVRNLSARDLAQVGGGTNLYLNDPTGLLAWLGGERAAGQCRASQ